MAKQAIAKQQAGLHSKSNSEDTKKSSAFNGFLWLLALSIAGAAVWVNSYLSEELDLIYRVLLIVICFVIAGALLFITEQGKSFRDLIAGSRIELKKIVWPERQDTLRTTFFVLVVVLIFSVILWLLDTFIGWLVSLILG